MTTVHERRAKHRTFPVLEDLCRWAKRHDARVLLDAHRGRLVSLAVEMPPPGKAYTTATRDGLDNAATRLMGVLR